MSLGGNLPEAPQTGVEETRFKCSRAEPETKQEPPIWGCQAAWWVLRPWSSQSPRAGEGRKLQNSSEDAPLVLLCAGHRRLPRRYT